MLIQLFEDQVNKNPGKIAVKEGETSLTYFQLNRYANRVARITANRWPNSAKADTVCLLFHHGADMIAAILGVLKAGKTYVSLSSDYPGKRVSYILGDSGAPLIITDSGNEAAARRAARENRAACLNIKEIDDAVPGENLPGAAGQDKAAYIMYTSGSTGRPKGVVQNHDNVFHFIRNWNKIFSITASDRLTLLSSFSHDASVMDIYAALLSGAALYPYNLKDHNLDLELVEFIIKEKITVWHSVPSVYNHFVNMLAGDEDFTWLRYIILGGEAVREHEINMFQKYFPSSVLANVYGQTESSVNSIWLVRPQDSLEKVIIGEPVDHTKIFLVSEQGKEIEPLETGEIVVASPYVSPGYWNNEKATKEQFTRDPAIGNLYWTGDLGRLLLDGTIEFMGRKDFQVKIRGYRIEPGEIETQLLRHKYIKEAVVTVKTDANEEPFLVAYFVGDCGAENEKKIGTTGLRQYLAKELPDYMIPAYFVPLERFPLTRSRKIDRKALPDPKIEAEGDYTAPVNEIEKKLVETWSEVLEIEKDVIGTGKNFFELGGHSLNAAIVISKVYKELDVKIPLPEFFKRQTIKGLFEYIVKEQARPARFAGQHARLYAGIEPVEKKEYYALSSAQKRLYFLQQMDTGGTAYNMSLVLPLASDPDKNKFEAALKKLVARHESLRTSFIMLDDEPVQRVHEPGEVEVKVEEEEQRTGDRGQTIEEKAGTNLSSVIRPFDLDRAPLLWSGIIKHPDGQYTWVVDIHHIVSDGTSHAILIDDFISLYNNEKPGPLRIQYKDFSRWQNHLFAIKAIKAQENYWMNQFSDAGEILRVQLPTDYRRPEVFTFAGDHYRFTLEPEEAAQFKQLSLRHHGTLYMNTLAALNTLFHKYTSQTDIIIGSGIAGRPHADLQRIVGMFVNTLATRNYPEGEKTYEVFLQEVIANSIRALENQDVQFEELVEKLEVKRDTSRNPLFDIFMIAQNFRTPGQGHSREETLRQLDVGLAADKNLPPLIPGNLTSKFDLMFFIYEQEGDVSITIEYYTGIFKSDTIKRLVSHFKKVIKTVIEMPAVKLKDIEIITGEEKKQILYEFNRTAREFPLDKTIHELFVMQVEKTPHRTAAAYQNSMVTYKELDERSNRAAHFLKSGSDIEIKAVVGILMDRSIFLMEAIFGILKAGGAYVPISSATPGERVKTIINDSRLGFLVSEKKHLEMLSRLQWECDSFQGFLCMDSMDIYSEEEPGPQLASDKLWDYVGESGGDEISAGGWQSSYTGEIFNKMEMEEYRENVYEKLFPLLHQEMHVLEIGCSTGITMYRLAPEVKSYHGTDFSNVVIRMNQERVKKEGHTNIALSRFYAHEIDQIKEKDFDLVIINSVVQYFNGYNYLVKVIKKVIDCMNQQGHIFIGDIIDHDLKEEFIRDLVRFKRANTGKAYKTKTDWSSELFVSRGFLEDLALDIPGILEIEFSKKLHTIENELTRFRYDALITIDKCCGHETSAGPVKNREKRKNQYDSTALARVGTRGQLPGTAPHHLAYVIYTSGSTGQPKGVMIEHCSVVNRLNWMQRMYPLAPGDIILQKTPITFDVSVWELFWWSFYGARLCLLAPGEEKDPRAIVNSIKRNHITTMHFVPSMLNAFLDYLEHSKESLKLTRLRQVFSSGEALKDYQMNRFYHRVKGNGNPGPGLINLYGPTEATVDVSYYNCSPGDDYSSPTVPIGKSIDNTCLYIFGPHLQFQPVGVVGELCISGVGLARGYLNQPELTAERFIDNKKLLRGVQGGGFLEKSPPGRRRQKIYKSGDLVRWLADGNIEFLGRTDSQVKIRGNRIELGEIENRLLDHEEIKEAVVVDREDDAGQKYLAAYMAADKSLDLVELRQYLLGKLPGYMIPSYFVFIEKIPLSSNGKLDRRALPDPRAETEKDNIPPRSKTEKKLAEIWKTQLKTDKVSINDNYFLMGGDSIKAIKMVNLINQSFEVPLKIEDLFRYTTIEALAVRIEVKKKQPGGEELKEALKEIEALRNRILKKNKLPFDPGDIEDVYPMSDIEKGMIYYSLKAPEAVLYHDQFIYQLHYPDFNLQIFKKASKLMMEKHSILRTGFILEAFEEPVQLLYKKAEVDIRHHDISSMDKGQQEKFIKETMIKDRKEPFNLALPPLYRMIIFTLGNDRLCVLLVFHHAILDGWSEASLMTELNNTYMKLQVDRDFVPVRLRSSYKDFIIEQVAEKKKKATIDYWKQELDGYKRLDFSGLKGSDGATGRKTYQPNLRISLPDQLREVSKKYNTSVKNVCFALYLYMLYMISYHDDITVGLITHNRPLIEDGDKILGCFLNSIPVRMKIPGNIKWSNYIGLVDKKIVELKKYEKLSLLEVSRHIDEKPYEANPIFDTIFNFADFHVYEESVLDNVEDDVKYLLSVGNYQETNTLFDFSVNTTGGGLLIRIYYSNTLVSDEAIKNLFMYFEKNLSEIMENPERVMSKNRLVPEKEKLKLLFEFNDTEKSFPGPKTIHELFADQVERTADDVALVSARELPKSKNISLTYRELHSKSNQLRYLLKAKGAAADTIVGIMVERCTTMLIGILAILKAGSAYLPIDADYPEEHINYMLCDSKVNLLVKSKFISEFTIQAGEIHSIFIDDHAVSSSSPQAFGSSPAAYSNLPPAPVTSLAYITYPRGSTDRPKGIMVEQSSLVNLLWTMHHRYSLRKGDTYLLTTSYLSIVSFTELFGWFLPGGRLTIPEKEGEKKPGMIADTVERWRVTHIHFVPSMFNAFVEILHSRDIHQLSSLKYIFLTGEALLPEIVKRFQRLHTKIALENLYLSTQAGVYAGWNSLAGRNKQESIPIGKPLPNTRFYILSKWNHPQPIGAAGELCIGGAGLARGYLNQPELTAEKFCHDLWDYRDRRKKMPGKRINMNYIYKTGDLARWLPDGNVEFLGRIDRQALPVPESSNLAIDPGYAAPHNEIERTLCTIWSKILEEKVENIGVTTGFFQLGGNSIKALLLVSEINETFNVNLLITHIFEYPTIKEFAVYLATLSVESSPHPPHQQLDYPGNNVINDLPGEQQEKAPGSSKNRVEIAVIGMAGRFPGAGNTAEFWENLGNGVETLSFISREELKEGRFDPGLVNHPHYVNARGGELANKEYFDASFFDYSAREAELMDPQIRIFHECAWEALEDAGYDPSRYEQLIGIYAGSDSGIHWESMAFLSKAGNEFGRWATSHLTGKDFLTTRVSYKLDLSGPAVVIQTACSTSLVAVHMAGRALLNGDCHLALAGGVSVNPSPGQGYIYQEGMILSPDGHCRAFDARAKGTVSGEGVGVVVLKPLQITISDGDHIYAVIKGSAINNDGIKKVGFPAPGIQGQISVIRAAQQQAGIEPVSIGYVETHGTGTVIGDPIEITALKKAFNINQKGTCALGSVKTNVGHLGAAAGVTAFIKTALVLKNKLIPPSLHFETPNPEIDFDNSPFYINTTLKEWKPDGFPRRAGVSSFGIGGTNAHVILEESPGGTRGLTPLPIERDSRKYQLILLSARTQTALDKSTENLAKYLKNNPDTNLANVAYTLQVGRRIFPYKRTAVCSTVNEAVEALTDPGLKNMETAFSNHEDPPIIFMFPGQGSQYVNMGLGLYQEEPLYQKEMDRCFEILEQIMGYNLKEILYPSSGGNRSYRSNKSYISSINQTDIAQPVIFSHQYALAKLFTHWGINPQAMIGHSIGEYTAAHLSGVFSLEDALKLVVMRGRLMQRMPPGAMISVPLAEKELRPLIGEQGNTCIAAVNSSSRCVVSGRPEAIKAFEKQLQEKGCETRHLHTSHAFHSTMMEPIMEEFARAVNQVQLNRPQIPYISNVSGQWIKEEEVRNPAYWSSHLRKTVRFADGISELLKKESTNALFVEIGPGNALSTFIKQHQDFDKEQVLHIINLIRHPHENAVDYSYLLNQIGRLWLYGKSLDWFEFHKPQKQYRIPLPSYQFDRKRYWLDGDFTRIDFDGISLDSLPQKKPDTAGWFYTPTWERSILNDPADLNMRGSSCWLVFMDECGIGPRLVKHLEQERHDLITVKAGTGFKRMNSREYVLNPTKKNNYRLLFGKLKKMGKIPGRIVHLWGITGNHDPGIELENTRRLQDIGFYSLLNIVQAIENEGIREKIHLGAVTDNMQEVTGEEVLCPAKATILGAIKVIPLEYPGIKCASIDIFVPAPDSPMKNKQIEMLARELESGFSHNIIALRGNHRWIQTMKPYPLEKSPHSHQRLREKGVYLVTGGLGGVGFTLAEYLATSVKARLILIGRSLFPPREKWRQWLSSHSKQDKVSIKIQKIWEWEKNGAEIMIASADVANREHMQTLIARVKRRFGQLNGVLHAAGIADYQGVIQRRTREMTEKIMAPKVMGTVVLDTLLENTRLDFFVLFSSIGNILYKMKFGQVGYNAANEYLESYACYQNCKGKVFTPVINWPDWKGAGMSAEAFNRKLRKKGENVDPGPLFHGALTPREGVEVFQRILENHLVRVSVCPLDLLTLVEQMEKQETGRISDSKETFADRASQLHQRPEMTVKYTTPGNVTEQTLVETWQRFLGVEPIGIHDDFFQLGGDSLLAIQLISAVNKKFNAKLSSHILLKAPTIAGLKQLLERDHVFTPSRLVEIQAGINQKPPLFLVHPIGGNIYFYRDLAETMPGQAIYGIKAQGVDKEAEPITCMEEMAALYIKELQYIQPEKPYYLGGASFGGMVAFEMAQQLYARGQEPALLFMVDTPGPGHMPDEFKDDADIMAYLLLTMDRNTPVTPGQIRQMEPVRLREFLLEHGGSEAGKDPDTFIADVYLRLRIFRSHLTAMFGYVPKVYPGTLFYFRARELMPITARDPEQAWINLAAKGLEIHDVPGDHITMNFHPHVRVIADVLKKTIRD